MKKRECEQRDDSLFDAPDCVSRRPHQIVQDPVNRELDGLVSFQADLPLPLQQAMVKFIEQYPNWDQYRLIQAAIAGFLVQNGIESRAITRLYIGNMFGSESLVKGSS